MEELEKIRALFNSGEESNIKLGLTLCEALPESEPLLQRYREFVGLYPDLFGESPEFWMQIQTVAYTDDVRLSLEHWETYLELFPPAESLTILVETDEAEIRLPDTLATCAQLRFLGVESIRADKPTKLTFYAPQTSNNIFKINRLRFTNVYLDEKPHRLGCLMRLENIDFYGCGFSEELRFDWLLDPSLHQPFQQIIISDKAVMPHFGTHFQLPAELLARFPAQLPWDGLIVSVKGGNHTLEQLPAQFPYLNHLTIIHDLDSELRLDLRETLPALPRLTTLYLFGGILPPPDLIFVAKQPSTAELKKSVLLPADALVLKQLRAFKAENFALVGGWDVLAGASELETLQVSDSRLHTLPDSWPKLTQLTTLIVSYNSLQQLPDWLGGLAEIHTLRIDHNQLQTLPESLWALLEDPNRSVELRASKNPFDPETKARLNSI